MVDSGHEKDLRPADPAGTGETTSHDEPLDVDNEEKDYIEVATYREPSSHDEKELQPGMDRARSYATTASAVTRAVSRADMPRQKKPWYKKVNPLKWGGVPEVPETRGVSREYNAPFLSMVYFQWVAPMMSVCLSRPIYFTMYTKGK